MPDYCKRGVFLSFSSCEFATPTLAPLSEESDEGSDKSEVLDDDPEESEDDPEGTF